MLRPLVTSLESLKANFLKNIKRSPFEVIQADFCLLVFI